MLAHQVPFVEGVVLVRCSCPGRSAGSRTVVVRLVVSDTVSPCTVISSLIPSGPVSRKFARVCDRSRWRWNDPPLQAEADFRVRTEWGRVRRQSDVVACVLQAIGNGAPVHPRQKWQLGTGTEVV